MKLKIQMWGKSAAIRIPNELMSDAGLSIGDTVEVKDMRGVLTLETIKPKYTLEELLAEMPNGLPSISYWNEITPVGKEIVT